MADQKSLNATGNLAVSQRPGEKSAPSPAPTHRDLLFGRMAVDNGLIEQEELEKAIDRHATAPLKSLADTLVQLGVLSEESREAIDVLLEALLAKHGQDLRQVLASLSCPQGSNGNPDPDDTVAFVPRSGDGPLPRNRFGDYELLGMIAHGGMGVVYEARHTKLNRLVALKMIRSGELADEGQVRRFYAEAEAAAKLDHPGIVPVYEVGEANGQHFYSMALIVGTSLYERVEATGPLPPKDAARLLKLVVEAIQYAHGKGIIHRDIKPQNILLDEASHPRLTDFGLAKQVRGPSDLTATGQVIGTPSFMPPEQAGGKLAEVGPASDVYSLGATFYFLLTGRPPFQAATPVETIGQVLNYEPVALRRLNPAIPRDLETICLKCLRKEIAKRYASAAELSADLGRWLDNKPIVARPVRLAERAWMWCKRQPTLVGMSLLLIVLTLTGTLVAWERRNASRAATLVEALMVAPPKDVPYAVENLTSVWWHAPPILRQRRADELRDAAQRLRAAEALARFGEVDAPFLVSGVSHAQVEEFANIVAALRHDPAAAIAQLNAEFATETRPQDRFRMAVALMRLGEVEAASQMLALAADPSQRTLFIHQFENWRGNLAEVAQFLASTTSDPEFQSGLCQAVGRISVDELSNDERRALEPALRELYVTSPSGAVHSAAGWALKQWKLDLPPTAAADTQKSEKQERDWYVNIVGMTFVKIPAGNFDRKDFEGDDLGRVALTRAFWLGDCEVTRQQFEMFLADPKHPQGEHPGGSTIDPQSSPTADCPACSVQWFHAILFCNWLSRREGLTPYYERTGEKQKDPFITNSEWSVWRSIPQSTGYRLPTEAEWEYACRARSTTFFSFGDDESSLKDYAVVGGYAVGYNLESTQPTGSRQPNGWGLFDMHGNVCEWNHDWHEETTSDARPAVVDPTGPLVGDLRVFRGGSFVDDALKLRSAYRSSEPPNACNPHRGFRVARTYR